MGIASHPCALQRHSNEQEIRKMRYELDLHGVRFIDAGMRGFISRGALQDLENLG